MDTVLELALFHLAVRDHDSDFGHDPRKHLMHSFDRLYPVVQEEALATAADLAQDRFANQPLVEFADLGPDRETIDGRGFDDGEITDAGERHL